jgi:hypothetical protein
MTTSGYGFCFRPDLRRGDCSGALHLWVADADGDTRFAPTPYDVSREEWDPVGGSLVMVGDDIGRHVELRLYNEGMRRDLHRVERIVDELSSRGRWSAGEVLDRWYATVAVP